MGEIQSKALSARTASPTAQGSEMGTSEKTIGNVKPSKSDDVAMCMGSREGGLGLKSVSSKRVSTGY